VEEADPTTGPDLIARQEAVWSLQWLMEQGEQSQEYGEDDEPEPLKEGLAVPQSILRVREEMGQLAQAPFLKVATALYDRDIAVRLAALEVLPKSSTAEGVSGFVARMLRDPCQQVRWRADEVLGQMVVTKLGEWDGGGAR
jgi:HEAT repeat protein